MERIWDVLEIDATEDKKEIKRAYARLSREIHPEKRPGEFQKLYEAYQKALQYASHMEKRKAGMTEAEAMPESAQEEELLLYEALCRVYKNRIVRQKYAEKVVEDLKKRQKFRKKIVIIGICALIGLIPAMIVVELFMVLLGISGGIADEAVIGIFTIAFLAIVVRSVTGYIDGE